MELRAGRGEPPTVGGRLSAKEGARRMREVEGLVATHEGLSGILHITAHPHGHDCQKTYIELESGSVWYCSSTEFGSSEWEEAGWFLHSMRECMDFLRSAQCATRERAAKRGALDPAYGRFISLYCAVPGATKHSHIQGLLSTSPVEVAFDEFLSRVLFARGKPG